MHDPQKIRAGKSMHFMIAALTFWGFFITIIVANRVSKINQYFLKLKIFRISRGEPPYRLPYFYVVNEGGDRKFSKQ